MLRKCQAVSLPLARRHVAPGYRRGCLIEHASDPAGVGSPDWRFILGDLNVGGRKKKLSHPQLRYNESASVDTS
jgi:hypothetical protein